MERLGFSPTDPHQAIEAAIHLSRYQVARPLIAGKRVLDAACGEGYGSRAMLEWGASAVDGVDVSPEAITRANELFGSDRTHFHQHAAERIDELFAPGQFDVAVSLETIEHVSSPESFLRALRRVVRPGGAIVVSCPNDHWYYPSPEQRNPFHVRKFTFDQFRELAEGVLGPATGWLVGTACHGFMNVPEGSDLVGRAGEQRLAMFEAREASSLAVPTEERVDWANCAYFVGTWGAGFDPVELGGAVLHPVSMDNGPLSGWRRAVPMLDDLDAIRAESARRQAALEDALRLASRSEISARTAEAENASMRETVAAQRVELTQARATIDSLQRALEVMARDQREREREHAEHSCYATLERKVTGAVPAPFGRVLRWAGSLVRWTVRRVLPR